MSSSSEDSDGDLTAPFLVHVAYQTGAFHRPDEFTPTFLPPHVSIYTWPTCTLGELAMEIAASKPSALPYPAVGTRLVFQLVYPDLRCPDSVNEGPARYAVKDLGSVVIGQGGPGADAGGSSDDQESERTLGDARFVVGDYVSCAILPPLSDGSVAPASNAKAAVAPGMRNTRGQRGGHRGGHRGGENGFARGGTRGGWGGRRDAGGGARVPAGDWRRGESLPRAPLMHSRGRGGRW